MSQSSDSLSILDIQLGGACNLKCIYCDTPKYGLPCSVNLPSIEKLMNEGNVKWIYVCGLREPTAPANLRHLKQILLCCKQKGIGLSMFSNMLNIDNDLLDYIVPTSINYNELPFIINWCMENGIFPLIGQLEDADSCSKIYKELEVKEENLNKFREYISKTYGVNYEMPACPATILGIHVTNTNKVILDKRTGLSCPWFWLDEPQLEIIANIEDMSYDEVVKRILEYRASKLQDVEEMERHIELYPFGGCGGNAKQLLRTYIDVSKKRK